MRLGQSKKCAKCNNPFTCNANDIENCHCSNVKLTEPELLHLKQNYTNCLCADCLKIIKVKF